MGCKIKIDFLFVALFTFLVVTDETLFAVYGFALITVHELGHILISIILNVRISEINFGVANIDICKPQNYENLKFHEKAILTSGGCILNIVFFLILWITYLHTKNLKYLYVGAQSAGVAVLNILPVESLDGGELLRLFTERFCKDFIRSEKICNFVSWIFLFVLAVLGFLTIVKCKYGFSAILLVLYLIYQKYI